MPSAKGLELSRRYVAHATDILRDKLGKGSLSVPEHIPFKIQVELENIVDRFHRAWLNPVGLPYSLSEVQEIARKKGKDRDGLLRALFPRPYSSNGGGEKRELRLLDKPTLFVDRDGKAIGWYLPNAFTKGRSEHVFQSVKDLSGAPESVLASSRISPARRSARSRMSRCPYAAPERCVLTPGHVNLSVCWYSLGPTPQLPSPSTSLTAVTGGGREFLASEIDTIALTGVLLALAHPELYRMQMDVMQELYDGSFPVENRDHMQRLFKHWSTPFTAFALTTNRETDCRRNTRSGESLMDMVSVFGRYSGGRLEVPLLGSRFVNNPGTAFIIPGYLFEHGSSRTFGERITITSFFRPNVGRGVLPRRYEEVGPPTLEELASYHGLERAPYIGGDIWG